MNDFRKIFRRIKSLLWTALTLLTVMAAVVVGIGKLLMPYSVHYQPELEDWLSRNFNQPVRVESFTGEWKAFGPRISLRGVTLMPVGLESEIAINHAALDIKPLNILVPGRPLYSFRIIGADLSLERTADGRYVLSGLGVSNTGRGKNSNPGLRDVALNGEVRLQDVSLTFDDSEREIHLVLKNVNGRLKADGSRIAAEIRAMVTDGDRGRVFGDLEAVIHVRLDSEQHLERARWHVKTGELMLSELVRQLPPHPMIPVSGRLNAELWGEWLQGRPQQMQGVLDLREAQLSSQSGPLIVDRLNSRFNFQFTQRKNWRLDLAGLMVEYAGKQWQSRRFSLARNLPQNLGLWVSADYVELDYPIQLTQRIMASYNTPWPSAVPKRAQGRVTDFDLVLDARWQLLKTSGQLENGHFWGWDKRPDVEGINAQINIDSGVGLVSFGGPSVRLDWLTVFRRPLVIGLTDCHLEILWEGKRDWQLDLNQCHAENDDISAVGRVRMASGRGKPNVDINVSMDRGDLSRFGDYWPENVMKPRTIHWLRTSLLKGQITKGRYSMVGDMDDFPFKNHAGRLLASAMIENATIKYADGWPQLKKASGLAQFDGPGMFVDALIGDTGGARVDKVTAKIPNFRQAVLDVSYETRTALPILTGFLKQTPLLDNLDMNPDQFVFDGESQITGHLHTRLGGSSEPMQVNGSLKLNGNQFIDQNTGIVLDDITGTLDYNREGLKAFDLTSSYAGYPVRLDVISDWDAPEVFRARVHGDLPVEKVVPDELLKRSPLLSRASGIGVWDISLKVASEEGIEDREIWLEIYSGLKGINIDLPAPMEKSKESNWPLLVRYPVRAAERVLTADFPGDIQLKIELSEEDSSPIRAAVQLGGQVVALPDPGQFEINGSTDTFDLDGWIDLAIDLLSEKQNDDGLRLKSANVQSKRVKIFDRYFSDVALGMTYEAGVIYGEFDSRDIDGIVRYYKNEKGAHSMSGEFERLMIPDAITAGVSMKSDPSELPEMHFYSKSFSYLGLELGETRIEGYPVNNGFHIESIEAQSPSVIFSARGDWLRDDVGERSDFNIRITSESLGTVLEAMDISSAMRGGQTLVHFDAWWEGPPAAFALERLNGEMDFSVIQGNIVSANAGAGRMLGLLSLTELPRRLAMDFRDVFDDGFSFDEAKGIMKLENGTSYTDDMLLSSTVADISIVGKADLVEQTFDYRFTVRPGVSKTLPVIGAITGGPVGAAAGLALQAILRDALGEAAEAIYTISGPWEDPLVEEVEKSRRNSNTLNTAVPEEPAAAPPETKEKPETDNSSVL